MALASLADRVQANDILEYPVVALNTPLQKNENLLNEMRQRRGSIYHQNPGGTVSGETLKAAIELAHRINDGKAGVTVSSELTPQEIIDNSEKVEK